MGGRVDERLAAEEGQVRPRRLAARGGGRRTRRRRRSPRARRGRAPPGRRPPGSSRCSARLQPKVGTTTSWVGVFAASAANSAHAAAASASSSSSRVDDEARLAQRRLRQRRRAARPPRPSALERARLALADDGGLSRERLDDERLGAARDRGDEGGAAEAHGRGSARTGGSSGAGVSREVPSGFARLGRLGRPARRLRWRRALGPGGSMHRPRFIDHRGKLILVPRPRAREPGAARRRDPRRRSGRSSPSGEPASLVLWT